MKKRSSSYIPFQNTKVAKVFDSYSAKMRKRLMSIRQLIFQIAEETERVGELEETLKWGSPSYLTSESGSGTTIRIDALASQEGKYAICVHCQTTLVGPFKKIYGNEFIYDANRGLILDVSDELPVEAIRHFIYMALTYHLKKK